MANIEGKVVIIMGASSGIGEATAKKLAQDGAKLVIAARREDRLKALVESLPNAEISYAVADVSNKEEVQAVIDLAVEQYGRVDVLYNNAGVMPTAPLSETRFPETQEWLKNNQSTEGFGLKSSDIADAVAYAISTPETVAVSEIMIRPTKQVI
ncbi:SDR family oxidoreductase [Paenibacillus caui]|uniref:SDR family oxidoreductase n=1 Tax=Paenibacillus caui TaxID=2873927 RepID=UPI001CAA3B22|nr:SDR family NAD(P)-dependent oxidoreductase [Paenibacillus caui]